MSGFFRNVLIFSIVALIYDRPAWDSRSDLGFVVGGWALSILLE